MNPTFATEMSMKVQSHQEWLALMNFGMGTLLQDQRSLIECVIMEAQRQRDRETNIPRSTLTPEAKPLSHYVALTMQELKLRFQCVPTIPQPNPAG